MSDEIKNMPRPIRFTRWPKGTAQLHGMTEEKAAVLWSDVKRGDPEAEAAILRDNAGYVRRRAMFYHRRSVHSDLGVADLFAEGLTGLLHAMREYNPSVGTALLSFAYCHVTNAIKVAVRGTGQTIRVPALQVFPQRDRVLPEELTAAVCAARDVLRLDDRHPAFRDEDRLMHEVIASDAPHAEELLSEKRRVSVLDELDKLSPRVKDMIVRSIFNEESLSDIGKSHGISRERVRQLRDAGLKKLASLDTIREYGEK